MSLLAVDIGSSRCKAVVFAVTGEILAQHACAYAPEFLAPSQAEMDAERFWQALCACSHAVSRNLSDPVRALCLSSHGETFVPVFKITGYAKIPQNFAELKHAVDAEERAPVEFTLPPPATTAPKVRESKAPVKNSRGKTPPPKGGKRPVKF